MNRAGLLAALGVLWLAPTTAPAADPGPLTDADRELLTTYARDTWRSLDALAGDGALPTDCLARQNSGWVAAGYTSPTDVAAYIWSTLAAEDLGLIAHDDASRRLGKTLTSLAKAERSHGFFFNWYDPKTGARLQSWPGGGPVRPFLSSVDNGWLAAALMMVANTRHEFRPAAEALLGPMNFGFFYDPFDPAAPEAHPGLLRGGYYPDDHAFTTYHYGMLNTEPRIASYIGIARGDLPADHYYRMTRVQPPDQGPKHSYLGVTVDEGTRPYRDVRIVPSWDGTMFEALMVPLFVPEAAWAEQSWGRNHPLYARAQIEYGLQDARLGFWGISASTDPDGGYKAYGIPALGASDPKAKAPAIVTPHASFLALPFAPKQAVENLQALALAFPAVYSPLGFFDAVDVANGRVAEHLLTLDQGMSLAAIANALRDNCLQRAFSAGAIESAVRPVIAPEHFESREIAPAVKVSRRGPTLVPGAGLPEVVFAWRAANLTPGLPRPTLRRRRIERRALPPRAS